jgi:RNA polymerase sigma factor (sigma-70 family)
MAEKNPPSPAVTAAGQLLSGKPGDKLPGKTKVDKNRVAAPDEIKFAFDALSKRDLLLLRLTAVNLLQGLGRRAYDKTADDLLHTTFVRVLKHSRKWKPEKVDFKHFLEWVMRSIVSSWHKRKTELPVQTESELDWAIEDVAAAATHTADEIESLEEDDQFATAAIADIKREFDEKNDVNAWMVFDQMLEGKGKVETMAETGMSEKDYLAAYKKVQRRIKTLRDLAASLAADGVKRQ